MDPQHRQLINSNLKQLMENIDYDLISHLLVERGLYTKAMVDDIQEETDKVLSLLKSLPTRGPKAFDAFVKLLRDTGQSNAADIIDGQLAARNITVARINNRAYDNRIGEPASVCATVVKARAMKEGPNIYRMRSKPRGLCLVINNINFEPKPRLGAENDSIKVDKVFHELDFKVKLRRDQNAAEMFEELNNFAKQERHRECDAAVVVIMSHGNENVIYGIDWSILRIQAIISLFDNANCIGLRGKPKIFFIQACRGGKTDMGVEDVCSDAALYNNPSLPPRLATAELRTVEDIFIVQPTTPGFTAMRHEYDGSWLIGTLVEVLMQNACEEHLIEIVNEVDRRIKRRMGSSGERQTTSTTNYGFNKYLYFNPGLP